MDEEAMSTGKGAAITAVGDREVHPAASTAPPKRKPKNARRGIVFIAAS
jgi:hypothetical protein